VPLEPCAGPGLRVAPARFSRSPALVLVAIAALGWLACGHAARSRQPFDQIQRLVTGKTEAEVERLLGRPDARESRLIDDDVWIWWDYTFLDGEHYPPELRGQAVHLEITFDRPAGIAAQDQPHAAWRVAGPFSVNFSHRLPRG